MCPRNKKMIVRTRKKNCFFFFLRSHIPASSRAMRFLLSRRYIHMYKTCTFRHSLHYSHETRTVPARNKWSCIGTKFLIFFFYFYSSRQCIAIGTRISKTTWFLIHWYTRLIVYRLYTRLQVRERARNGIVLFLIVDVLVTHL